MGRNTASINRQFARSLEHLYAAGTGHVGFQPFLESLCGPFESHVTCFQFHDTKHQDGSLQVSCGVTPNEMAKYTGRENLWLESGGPRLVAEGVIDDRGLVTDRQLFDSSFWQDQLVPLKVRHGMGLCLWADDAGQFATLTVNRDSQHGHYEKKHFRLAHRLLPHLRNVYALQQQLSWLETLLGGFRAALDRLPTGAVLLDRHNRIVFSNREATRLCAERRGLSERMGQLTAIWAPDRESLGQLIKRAAAGLLSVQPETLMLRDAAGQPAATVTAVPVSPVTTIAWSETAVAAVVFVKPIRPRKPSADALRKIFSLSKAEAALAESLAEGKTLAQSAASASKSMATLRTQLRALLAKTGTHRQSELVQLLVATVASLSE